MTKVQQKRFKAALEAKRAELIREIEKRRRRLAIDRTSDPMDQVRNICDRDIAIRNVDRMYGVLRLVDDALREIRYKTFGQCARCGDSIPLKRLHVVPWSPYCVVCQEHAEHSEADDVLDGVVVPYALAG
jgi:DnaK suppressor protein